MAKNINIEFETEEIKEECTGIIWNTKYKLMCSQGYVIQLALQLLDAKMKGES